MTEPTNTPDQSIRFTYTNWKGETSERHATPVSIRWGSTGWHPYECWLMCAYDHDKEAEREFSLVDFAAPRPQPATASPVTVKPIKWTRIPSAYEMRSGKKKNWEARVDGVRIGQVEHPEDKAGYEERHRQRTLSYIQPEAPSKVD